MNTDPPATDAAPVVPDAPSPGPGPRPAGSLLVMRGEAGRSGAGGAPVALLMARRGAGHRFMPNVLVFPGGSVDAADHHARLATPLRPTVQARLERSADPSLARALAIAACRELTEEVGLSLGTPPRLEALDYLCRAITPPDRSMRFDARFFVVGEEHVTGTLRASAELEDPGWYTVAEARQGELALATRAVLAQFETWLARGRRDGPVPVLRDRRWTEE